MEHHINMIQRQSTALLEGAAFLREDIKIKTQTIPGQNRIPLLNPVLEIVDHGAEIVRPHLILDSPFRGLSVPDV